MTSSEAGNKDQLLRSLPASHRPGPYRQHKSRLSLPSIRISEADNTDTDALNTSRLGKPESRRLSASGSAKDVNGHGHGHDFAGRRPSSDSQNKLQDGNGTTHRPSSPANEPVIPVELMTAIQQSMKNCAEYERKCASLEHNIEHKILIWTDLLDKYENQDTTASDIRDSIAASLSALQSIQPTIHSSKEMSKKASASLETSKETLDQSSDIVKKSQKVMTRLEEFMKNEEVMQKKVEKMQMGLLVSASVVVALVAILLTWLYKA